mmetsp:Transcript_13812/g.29415  ORF Transcript_13812/g.29415 Transcript_13812/m.29415 type:complete len:85 (-) Transcript_13812:56-310(-)
MWILKDEEEVDGAAFLFRRHDMFWGARRNYFEILWEIQGVRKKGKKNFLLSIYIKLRCNRNQKIRDENPSVIMARWGKGERQKL